MAKQLVASCLGMLVVAYSGCDAIEPTLAAQKTQQTKANTVVIEMYGDSTAAGCTPTPGAQAILPCHTAGYAVANPSPEATLESLLQSKYGAGVTVVNRGVAGNTIPTFLSGDGVNLPWARQVAQSKAQIVTLNFGINDSNPAAKEPADAFRRNLFDLIRIAKASGKIVVVETASPVNNHLFAALPSYVAASIAAANESGVQVINQYGYLTSQSRWNAMLADTVHPTQAGYNLRARIEFETLDQVVGKMLAH